MNTEKVAITMPSDLVAMIDTLSRQQKVSRSKFISRALREKLMEERRRHLRESYDRVFSDNDISKEQLETAKWFEGSGNKAGQEW
ncbi:MAG: ribbon-helix-helix protein, CopG family [Deltaproteobacteria bacterium]